MLLSWRHWLRGKASQGLKLDWCQFESASPKHAQEVARLRRTSCEVTSSRDTSGGIRPLLFCCADARNTQSTFLGVTRGEPQMSLIFFLAYDSPVSLMGSPWGKCPEPMVGNKLPHFVQKLTPARRRTLAPDFSEFLLCAALPSYKVFTYLRTEHSIVLHACEDLKVGRRSTAHSIAAGAEVASAEPSGVLKVHFVLFSSWTFWSFVNGMDAPTYPEQLMAAVSSFEKQADVPVRSHFGSSMSNRICVVLWFV